MPPTDDHTGDGEPAQQEQQEQQEQSGTEWLEAPPKINGPIVLADYDPRWPEIYERQAAAIRAALPASQIVRLEHIGSTSVPGLAAKPKIDILLVVPDTVREEDYVPGLRGAGFRLVVREPDWYGHRLLRKGPEPDDFNLHVYPRDCPEIAKYLRFRDHLRASQADRELYEQVKRKLAGETWTYTQNYADAKTEVIEQIVARSRQAS
jgi:GrpB-like predicted nucleotidyltransferase (UPF0157 family)